MKKLENPKNLRELAKINDEKAREEICRIVIKEFSKAKREFVATYCGPDKEFRLYKDSVTKLSTTFKGFVKDVLLIDSSLQNQLFDAIADGCLDVEGIALLLMSFSVIPHIAQDTLEKDHTVEKMFSAAYAWQVALCHLNFNVLRAVDEKYNWHITFPLLEAINNSKPK